MTVSYKKSGAGGGSYYTNCMTGEKVSTVDDYYTGSSKEPPGIWYVGPNADKTRSSTLGIEDRQGFKPAAEGETDGDVERFARLVQGRHANDEHPLVQNVDSPNRVAFHDFTMSAPKSISVVWSQASEELKSAIEAAQLESSRTFLDFMSGKSFTRAGKNGVFKMAAPLRGALFPHGSSRENDPQLHTHAVMMNVCEREDGKTSALETLGMMRWAGSAASLYHADLAWRMRELGFAIQRQDKLFELAGVPREAIQHFSKRRAQIVSAVERRQVELGMAADAKAAAKGLLDKAAIETRTEKNELTREQLEALWHEEGRALGFTGAEVQQLLASTQEQPLITEEELYEQAREAVNELTETTAVFSEPALLTTVAVKLQGQASPEHILQAVEQLKARHLMASRAEQVGLGSFRLEEAEDVFTTIDMIGVEQRMLDLSRRHDDRHVLSDVELPPSLDHEQREAALAACTDPNAVTVIEGAAGAGKTFTMASIARVYEKEGYSVTGLSSSWTAALNLKDSAQLADGRAITGWVNDVRKGVVKLDEKSLVVVDEAGMVGARDMHNLLDLAARANAKVILLGDTLQQKAVSSGDALRCISSQIGSKRINIIRRQNDEAERAAVYNFFDGRAEDGLRIYAERGCIKMSSGQEETHAEMIEAWAQTCESHPDKTHLMLATDRRSVAELNRLAHEQRRNAGEIEPGLWVRNMDCSESDELVEFSVGDQVVSRMNDREQDLYNRTRGTIEAIDGSVIKLRTESGLVEIDTAAEQWQHRDGGLALQHAYATTVYASQGLTVDHVLVKDTTGLKRNSAGVAMSRHRESCTIFVDRQARHEAAMKPLRVDEWKPLRSYTDKECLADLAKSWSRSDSKASTLDYKNWKDAQGLPVKARDEADVLSLERSAEMARLEIDRIREQSKTGVASIEMPFQRSAAYTLPELRPEQAALERAIEKLQDDGIEPEVIEQAFKSGAMNLNDQGEPVFCARNSQGGLVRVVKDNEPAKADLMREQFAPVLPGDPDRVEIVRSGREALHLQSLQLRSERQPSTVIVSGGEDRSLGMPDVRKTIEKSKDLQRHEQEQVQQDKEPSIIVENRAQAEAQRIAQEQEQARQAAERGRIL